MQGLIGLLLYVAVMVLSRIMKKMAEERARQARTPAGEEGESYTVTLEEMLADESHAAQSPGDHGLSTHRMEPRIGESELKRKGMADFDDWDEWEDRSRQQEKQESNDLAETQSLPRRPQWAEAIVLAEIIREPRAKRPWPSR